MKAGRRNTELGGGQTASPFRPQNTAWTPSASYSDARQMVLRGGADQAAGFGLQATTRHVQNLYEVLAKTHQGHLGSSEVGSADETHLLNNPDIDWNRHMDEANIPEAIRQQYGDDIKNGVIHRLRMKSHGLSKYDTGPRGPEQFGNTFSI